MNLYQFTSIANFFNILGKLQNCSLSFAPYVNLISDILIESIWSLTFRCYVNFVQLLNVGPKLLIYVRGSIKIYFSLGISHHIAFFKNNYIKKKKKQQQQHKNRLVKSLILNKRSRVQFSFTPKTDWCLGLIISGTHKQ